MCNVQVLAVTDRTYLRIDERGAQGPEGLKKQRAVHADADPKPLRVLLRYDRDELLGAL